MKTKDHQLLEVLKSRDVLSDEQSKGLWMSDQGDDGEVDFEREIVKHSDSKWVYLTDLRLGINQIDAIVFTPIGPTIYEVKNYNAHYVITDEGGLVNGQQKKRSDFIQLERNYEIFCALYYELGFKGVVRRKVVFINEHDSVDIHTHKYDNLFVKRAHLKRYFQALREECRNPEANWICDPTFERNAVISKHTPERVPRIVLADWQLRKIVSHPGIRCAECGSGRIDYYGMKYHYACEKCGFCEIKQEAIARTTCEYGLIFYSKDIELPELIKFLGPNIQRRTIAKIMRKYFKLKQGIRYISFENPVSKLEYSGIEISSRYKNIWKK